MMKRNKGFSLVELIIVIAIMAILVGVMAPQLIKYIEKSKVSADIQRCDALRNALIYAASDPEVIAETSDKSQQLIDSIFTPGNNMRLDTHGGDWLTCKYAQAVTEILGYNPFASGLDLNSIYKSTPGPGGAGCLIPYVCANQEGTAIAVGLAWSDRTGKKQGTNYSGTYEHIESCNNIYVK